MWLKSSLYLLVYGILVTHFNIVLPLGYDNIAAQTQIKFFIDFHSLEPADVISAFSFVN